MRLVADLVVGAFFAHEKDKDREVERGIREGLVRAWLGSGGPPGEELLGMQRAIRARLPVFHWMLEFPEVFYAERPDPLDENEVNRAAYMDAFVGNPPFAGKNAIAASNDEWYLAWLQVANPGAHGNANLSAHFLRRAGSLLGSNGTLGLIATKSIAQGDTRATGLQRLVANGFTIYDATASLPWAGSADVVVSVVHLAVGTARKGIGQARLDGRSVTMIDSRLAAGRERADALQLHTNAELTFQGSTVLGVGFTLSPAQREALVQKDKRNAVRIFPYLGGEDANTDPSQAFSRHVINFAQLTLGEAECWPELLAIVREKVKPERDTNKREVRRQYWWRFGECAASSVRRDSLARPMSCDGARNETHVLFVPTHRPRVQRQILCVSARAHDSFRYPAIPDTRALGVPAFRIIWREGHCAAYRATEVVGTFPFPHPDPRAVLPALEDIGQRLYDFRAAYMVDENVGLTITYNRLKDPACTEPRILELRELHEEMDRKVLEAYAEGDPEGRWLEVEVPPYCPMNDSDKNKLGAFEDAVIAGSSCSTRSGRRRKGSRGLARTGEKRRGRRRRRAVRERGVARKRSWDSSSSSGATRRRSECRRSCETRRGRPSTSTTPRSARRFALT